MTSSPETAAQRANASVRAPNGAGPFGTAAFARAYDRMASRITGPISAAVLDRVAPVGRGVRLLDVGAGAGALALPAALRGAHVTAVDVAPGMVWLLEERLSPFPGCAARRMDGEQLDATDESFDVAVSVMGVSLFEDWKRGLNELVRVTRRGGRTAIASWRKPPGGGPFVVLGQALQRVFPDRPPPPAPSGFLALAEPERMADVLRTSGLVDVAVEEIACAWDGTAGPAYLEELREFHGFVPPYAALSDDERADVDAAILEIVDGLSDGDRIVLTTSAVVGTGLRA